MNQQIQMRLLSDNSTLQLDDLILSKQYKNSSPYTITTAELLVYDVEEIVASGTLVSGLSYQDSEQNSLVYTWTQDEVDSLTENPKSNYRARWRLNISSDVADRIATRFFDIVYWKLLNPITEIDLLNEKPILDEVRQTKRPTVTEAIDATNFKCNQLHNVSGFWDGSIIEFTSSNNRDIQIKIDSWDDDSNKITLAESLPNIPQLGDLFTLKRSFKQEIESSWNEILTEVNSWRPNLTDNEGLNKTVDSYDLRLLHLYKSVAKAAASAVREEDDPYDLIVKDYNLKTTAAFTNLKIKVDEDNSGTFDNESDLIRSGQIWGSL